MSGFPAHRAARDLILGKLNLSCGVIVVNPFSHQVIVFECT